MKNRFKGLWRNLSEDKAFWIMWGFVLGAIAFTLAVGFAFEVAFMWVMSL